MSNRGNALWLLAKNGNVPPGAVSAGYKNEQKVYIARFKNENNNLWIPGHLNVKKGMCEGTWKTYKLSSRIYEVLCSCEAEWINMNPNNNIPRRVLTLNKDSDSLFIGRTKIKKNTFVGMVVDKNKKLYVWEKSEVIDYETYEILTLHQQDLDALMKHESPGYFRYAVDKVSSLGHGLLTRKSNPGHQWKADVAGHVPQNAVAGGKNHLGDIYVARTKVYNEWLPGKLIPTYKKCFVSNNGKEISSGNYEVLCGNNTQWKRVESGDILPQNAILCSNFCIARVRMGENSIVLGKASISDEKCRKCYILMNREEISYNKYEILIDETSTPKIPKHVNTKRSNNATSDESDSDNCARRDCNYEVRQSNQEQRKYDSEEESSTNENHTKKCQKSRRKSCSEDEEGRKLSAQREHVSSECYNNYGSRVKKQHSAPNQKTQYLQDKATSISKFDQRNSSYHRYPPSYANKAEEWIDKSNGDYPKNAVVGGKNSKGPIYVARLYHEGAVLPGKLIPEYKYCYSSYQGEEIRKSNYQVLCSKNVTWMSMTSSDKLPRNSFLAGKASCQSIYYVGRVKIEGSTFIGKVEERSKLCFIVRQKKEECHTRYEILVFDSSHDSNNSYSETKTPSSPLKIPGNSLSDTSEELNFRLNTSPTNNNALSSARTAIGPNPIHLQCDRDATAETKCWISSENGVIPTQATEAFNSNKSIFLARAKHQQCLIPGISINGINCLINYEGQRYEKKQYEVLCMNNTEWHLMKEGENIPENAVPCGYAAYGQTLYFGRKTFNIENNKSYTIIGEVNETGSKCYVVVNGKQEAQKEFEILVNKSDLQINMDDTQIQQQLSTSSNQNKISQNLSDALYKENAAAVISGTNNTNSSLATSSEMECDESLNDGPKLQDVESLPLTPTSL